MLSASTVSAFANTMSSIPLASASTTALGVVGPGWVNMAANMAPMAAMVVFFAPYSTLKQVSTDKDVGSLPLLPYSSMIANCFLWMLYGLLKGEATIWGTNVVGLAFGLYYFRKFVRYAPPTAPSFPGSVRLHVNSCLAVVLGALSLKFLFPFGDPASIIGNLAVLFCTIMFGSPLASLKTVFHTKSAASIPLPFTLATVLNCFLWSVTGLFQMKDANVYFPNLLGLFFGLTQVFLKGAFGDGDERMGQLL